MKNKKFFIINILVAVLSLTIMTLFLTLLKDKINSPGGIVMYVVMIVLSLAALVWFTVYASFLKTVPESLLFLAIPTYIFQLTPILIFFLSGDKFTEGTLLMVPILLIMVLSMAYVGAVLFITHYNKKAIAHDKMTEATVKPVEDEKEYYNDDGSFKGLE